MENGVVFKIQKFSIHDGPGIRTTVFLKGCPLKCWWCHNPEGLEPSGVIVYHGNRCLNCGNCSAKCPSNALQIEDNRLLIDKSLCSKCYKCIEICPANALELIGKTMSTEQIIDVVSKDIIFYDESGGGVTFSGGEPLMQYEFLIETLKNCKKLGINTAVDTSGYTAWVRLKAVSNYTDLFLYDLKFMDEEKHKKYTGVSNKIILNNLELLSKTYSNICIRVPVIPGINDNTDNLNNIGLFLKKIKIKDVNILPYHSIGSHKYKSLDVMYNLEELRIPSASEMQNIADLFNNYGIRTKIGG
jgi:pyruvate formate lyase activating enzyme